MSIFSSIGGFISSGISAVKNAITSPLGGAVIGGALGGPTGAMLGSSIMGSAGGTLPSLPGGGSRTLTMPAMPGSGFTGRSLGLPSGTSPSVARMIGSPGTRGYTGIMRAANSMCARFPQWCVSVGGVSQVASMMWSGQLPIPRRRRRRGITPKDLSSFRRVASLIKTYGPTARKVPAGCAPRKHCRTRRT